MNKSDFKIEIIEKVYGSGEHKFFPTVFIKNQEYLDMTRLTKFFNNLRSDDHWFKIKPYIKCQIVASATSTAPTMSMELHPYDSVSCLTKDDAIEFAEVAINNYLQQEFATNAIETIIHKI